MQLLIWLVIISWSLVSCQAQSPSPIIIIDGDKIIPVTTIDRTPINVLNTAEILLSPSDLILVNGYLVQPQQANAPDFNTLQVRRAISITLVSPTGEQELLTTANTVGETLHETGIQLYSADFIDPPPDTPINEEMRVTYRPSQEFTINTSNGVTIIRSSAQTVGETLAEAGIPLIGLDSSYPGDKEALPADGQIQIVRVSETVTLAQKPIPFKTETLPSPDIELGTQEITQPGENGLAVERTRIRYEDGQEVSRVVEEESIVRPPQTRIVTTGSQIVVKSTTVDGVDIEYWRAYEMYATIYSPCNSGTSGCSYGTASGLKAGKGVVAVDPSMYNYLQGQRIYVPGYGFAVIGDLGGGYIVEDLTGISRYRWIDLGFDDNNIVDMTGWLTVYFLAPAPAAIPPVMQ